MVESMKKYKLLYIEDDEATRKLVRRILTPQRFDFYEASNALDGFAKVDEIHPDIVLVDLDLPDLTGLEFSTKLRSNIQTKDIIIVAVTGKKEFSSKEKTIIAGCDGFIPKPFDIDQFEKQILEFAKGKREEISPEHREDLITEYQAELVAKLEEKIRMLQDLNVSLSKSNALLKDRESLLKEQNNKLLKLTYISNILHKIRSLDEFIHIYPDLVVEHLGYKRCILFQVDLELNKIYPASWSGVDEKEVKQIHLKFDRKLVEKLISELEILFITDLEKIKELDLEPIFEPFFDKIKPAHFAMGYVGPQLDHHVMDSKQIAENNNINKMLDRLYQNIEPDSIQLELEKYVAGYLFKFTGILYVDNGMDGVPISDFDKQILNILLETSKVVYENISLIQILQKLYMKAGQDAITDPLTGIYNYRYFINQLIRELNRAQRYKIPLSVAMIDIDYFKVYNDNFGHLAGDYVLRKVARILSENTRISDIVARYGGEEFTVILPEATKDEAFKLADKLRRLVENYEFPNQERMPNGNVTISIGVASYPEDGNLPEQIIDRADIALYKAKNSGRNKVCMYNK
jgi:diguanylate cyclase (GGDEF)-like protein